MDWDTLHCPNRYCPYFGQPFHQGGLVRNGTTRGQPQAPCGGRGRTISMNYGTAYVHLDTDSAMFEIGVITLVWWSATCWNGNCGTGLQGRVRIAHARVRRTRACLSCSPTSRRHAAKRWPLPAEWFARRSRSSWPSRLTSMPKSRVSIPSSCCAAGRPRAYAPAAAPGSCSTRGEARAVSNVAAHCVATGDIGFTALAALIDRATRPRCSPPRRAVLSGYGNCRSDS